jgi:hypothetical protein
LFAPTALSKECASLNGFPGGTVPPEKPQRRRSTVGMVWLGPRSGISNATNEEGGRKTRVGVARGMRRALTHNADPEDPPRAGETN